MKPVGLATAVAGRLRTQRRPATHRTDQSIRRCSCDFDVDVFDRSHWQSRRLLRLLRLLRLVALTPRSTLNNPPNSKQPANHQVAAADWNSAVSSRPTLLSLSPCLSGLADGSKRLLLLSRTAAAFPSIPTASPSPANISTILTLSPSLETCSIIPQATDHRPGSHTHKRYHDEQLVRLHDHPALPVA